MNDLIASTLSPYSETEPAEIWTPVVGLQSGAIVKLPGGLTFNAAHDAAAMHADSLAGQGRIVDWSGARRA